MGNNYKLAYKKKRRISSSQSVDILPILKKIDFLINQSGLNCLKRANIRYLIPKKCSFLYFSVRNIKGCDKADLKNRLCQQPEKNFFFLKFNFNIFAFFFCCIKVSTSFKSKHACYNVTWEDFYFVIIFHDNIIIKLTSIRYFIFSFR